MNQKKQISQVGGLVILLIMAIGGGFGIYATASSANQLDQMVVLSHDNLKTDGQIYFHDDYKFGFVYPDGWTLTEASTPPDSYAYFAVILRDPVTEDHLSFSLLNPSMEGIVRNSLSLEKESDLTFAMLSGTKLTGTDLKDGSLVTMVIARSDKYLYQITSYADESVLDNFIKGFNISK